MANQGRINIGVGFNVDQSGLNQLKASLASIQNMQVKDLVNVDSKGKAMDTLREVKRMAGDVEKALQDSFNPTLNTYNIDTFKKKLNESVGPLSKVQTEMAKLGAEGTIAFRNLATAISSTKLSLRESHDLIKAMGTTLMNTVKWTVASSAINTITGSVQKAWSYTKSLDESLNNIMIVTDKSADSMAQFARQANKAAKELGKSTRDYTDASLIYYQQGLDDAQVKARTETTLRAANVTGQSADVVSEQLTAVWNGYKVQAQEAELYVDKLAAVAATTAADLEELSTGMSKVASAANTMGVDIDQLNAMLATTVSVTRQAPESVGTAFKTVFARIGDIEAGISDETTLGEYTKKMSEMGINVLDANNKLRDQGDVIEEIGNKWSSMSREQQIALSQTMAGTRQYNNLLALFDNWIMYEQAMKTSANAAGTLQKQQDTYMESVEAHMEQLRTAGERVYQALLDPDSANDLLDVLTEIVDKFGSFIESIGGGGNLLMSLIPIMTRVFSGSIATSLTTFVTNLRSAGQEAATLKSALAGIEELDATGGLSQVDKKINDLRRTLILLKQQGVITAEEFNTMTDELIEYGNAASEVEKKQESREKTKERLGALLDADLGEKGTHKIANKDKRNEYFDRVYKHGDNLSSKGLGAETIKNTISDQNATLGNAEAANGYKQITEALESIDKHIDSINNKNIKFAKNVQSVVDGQERYNKSIIDSKREFEKIVEQSESIKQFYTEKSPEQKKFASYETRISKLLSNDYLDVEQMATLQKLQSDYANFTNARLQELQGNFSKEELESVDIKIKAITASADKFKKSIEDINNNHQRQEDQIEDIKADFEALNLEAEKLKKAKLLGSESQGELTKKANNLSKLLNDTSKRGELLENPEQLQHLYEEYQALLQKAIDEGKKEIKGLSKDIENGIVDGLGKSKAKADGLGEALKNAFAKANLELKIKQFVNFASNIGMAASALKNLINLGEIWNNQDLSVGEKVFQTVTNVGTSLSMLLPTVSMITAAISKKNTTTMASTITDIFYKKTQDKVTEEMTEQAYWVEILKELQDNLNDEQRKAIAGTLAETAARKKNNGELKKELLLKKEVDKDIDNNKTSKLKKLKEKAPTTAAGKISTVGGGVLAGAIAGFIGSAALSKLVTDGFDQQQKNFEAASDAAKQAQDNLNKVTEAYDNLSNSLQNISSLKDSLKDLTEGSVEWEKAIADINTQTMQLLETYPELAKDATYVNGVLTLNEGAQTKVERELLDQRYKAQGAAIIANQTKQEAEIKAEQEKLAGDVNKSVDKKAAGVAAGTVLGAIGGGIASGMAMGSFGGPIGIAIGAAIGLGLGALAGGVQAANAEAEEDRVDESIGKLAKMTEKERLDALKSESALAEKLDKSIEQLTESEKALLNNTAQINALAEQVKRANELKLAQDTEYHRQRYLSHGYSASDAAAMAGMTASSTDNALEEEMIAKRAEQIQKKAGNNKDLIIAWAKSQGITLTKDDIKSAAGKGFEYKDANGEWQKMSYETMAHQQASTEVKNTASSKLNALEYKKQLDNILKDASSDTTNILKSLLASNKKIIAQDLEDFDNKTIAELQDRLTRAAELGLSDNAITALRETLDSIDDYHDNIATIENWGGETKEAINKVFNENGEWQAIYDKFKVSQIRAFGKAFTQIELLGGKRAEKAAMYIFGTMLPEKAAQVLEGINWNSETILADFSLEMEKVGKSLDYTSGEGFQLAYALARANNQMVISKEGWKETADILESLSGEQAALDIDGYQHLIEQYGSAISEYFVQMEDGTYRLTTAAIDFQKTIDKIEEQKIESAIESEIESIKSFGGNLEKVLEHTFQTIEDTDKEITARNILDREESVEFTNRYGETFKASSVLSNAVLNKGSGYTQAEAQAMLQGYLYTDEGRDLAALLDIVYTEAKGNENWWSDGSVWNEIVSNYGGKSVNITPGNGYYDLTEDQVNNIVEKYKGQYGESVVRNLFEEYTDENGATKYQLSGLAWSRTYQDMATAIAQETADYENEQSGVGAAYQKKSDIASWLHDLSTIGALSSEDYEKFTNELNSLDTEAFELKTENGEDSDFVKKVKQAIDEADPQADTEKLQEYIDQLLKTVDSEEELSKVKEKIKGLVEDAGIDPDTLNLNNKFEEAELALNVKLEDKAIENFKTQVEEITNLISTLDSRLSHLSNKAETLYGEDRLRVLQEQQELIEQQIELLELQTKVEEAEIQRQRTFKADGDTNYEAGLKGLASLLDVSDAGILSEADLWKNLGISGFGSQEEAINSIVGLQTKILSSSLSGEALATAQSYLALIQQTFEPIISGKTLAEKFNQENELLQNNLDKFNYALEFELDENELKREFNALKRDFFIDENDFSTITESYIADYQTVKDDIQEIEQALRNIDSLDITPEAKLELRKELTAQYGEKLKEIKELDKSIDEQRIGALNKISESYEKQISYLEEINSLLNTQKSALELVYGEDAFEMFEGYYEATLNNSIAVQNAAQERFASAAAKYATINDGMSDEEKEAIIEEYTAAGQVSADAMYAAMEARRDKYLNDTEIAIKNFNKSIYGDLDTDLFSKEWEWTKSQSDKYFDSVQSLYQKDMLAAQFDTAANEATSLRVQEQINKLKREELAQLENIEKLSEYDVKHAQQKLEILQAEIALREAQENKTQMRLMRGADGSYSYQYVADQNAITEAQNALTEARNSLYDLEMEEYISSIDEFQSAMQELGDLIRELGEDGFTEEELAYIEKRKNEVKELATRSTQIRQDVFESAEIAASTFGVNLDKLTQGTLLKTTEDINSIINTIATNGIQDSYSTLMASVTSISNTYTTDQKNAAEALITVITGENGLVGAYQSLAETQDIVIEGFETEYNDILKLKPEITELSTYYDGLVTSLGAVEEMYRKIAEARGLISDTDDEKHDVPPPSTEPSSLKKTNKTVDVANTDVYLRSEGNDWVDDENGGRRAYRQGNIHYYDSTGNSNVIEVGNSFYEDENTTYKIIGNEVYTDVNGWGYVKAVNDKGEIFYLPIENLVNVKPNYSGVAGNYTIGSPEYMRGIGFDTGGYTGEWGADGRMAMLHEKEIVLNKHDTENFLDALSILRELNLSMMAQISHFGIPFSNSQTSILQQLASQPIEQNVTIQAEFPNATDKDEIKEAFNDLINLATQYVHQDNKH